MSAKIYTFSAEPTAFNPVIEKLDELAIKKGTSRSEVLTDFMPTIWSKI